MQDFVKLREDAAKKAAAIGAASKRHVDVREACKLFNAFSAAEAKMVKFTDRQCSVVRHSPERDRHHEAVARQDRRHAHQGLPSGRRAGAAGGAPTI